MKLLNAKPLSLGAVFVKYIKYIAGVAQKGEVELS
jgi:hypothetical protein